MAPDEAGRPLKPGETPTCQILERTRRSRDRERRHGDHHGDEREHQCRIVDHLLDTCAQPAGGEEQLQREQQRSGRAVRGGT